MSPYVHALRSGALDVNGFPGTAHRRALRVRGLDRPPRQSCLTPAPSTPDSVEEPSPQVRARSRSPEGREAWRPTRAFAALAFTTLAARAQVAEAARPHGSVGPRLVGEAGEPRSWGKPPGCPQADRPRSHGWPCWRLVAGHTWKDYDDTLGYPGEGPQMPRSTPSAKSEALTLVTANVTSWSTGTGAGILASEVEVLVLQEVRLREDSLRAARSEAKRAKYHGTWAAAKRIGQRGPASSGLATLVCETRAFRAVAPDSPSPQWKEGRWTHTAIGAGGTHFHVINFYGWPQGTPDLWKNQNALWKKVFGHAAGLGNVPWVMAGDWNVIPDELWLPALAPRTSGWLPDVGSRRPTCFPVKGEPTEKDFSLVSHCLRAAVADYEFMPVGILPTHRAVRLTLNLGALREPLRSLRKPRTIPHPEPDQGPPQGTRGDEHSRGHRTPHRQAWVKPRVKAPGTQAMWDAWTKAAEGWLLGRAGIGPGEEGPYRGRGTAPVVRKRMPLPISTHQRNGEVHGRAKIWTAQTNRYRELARIRQEQRQHYGDILVGAIAANPPKERDPLWVQRDLKIVSGRATPEDLDGWAREATALADEENRRVTAARRKAWSDWVASSWNKSSGKVYICLVHD